VGTWTSRRTKSHKGSIAKGLEADRLGGEIDRLVQALATSTDCPQAVVDAIASRQQRLTALEARLRAAEAAPEAISLQARRLESDARRRLNDLSGMLDKNPDQARSAMLSLLDGPLVCTAVETSEGPRFQIEGTAVIGRIFTVESSVSNSASPRGFEGSKSASHHAVHAADRDNGAERPAPPKQPKPANPGSPGRLPDDLIDAAGVVETALAEALALAARAGQWSVVSQLAAELEARRRRHDGGEPAEVVSLADHASKRA
jgi:hypothetical protein